MKRLAKSGLLAAILALAALNSISCWWMNGSVRAVAVQRTSRGALAIGHIENRDLRYNPFSARNFIDMLEFELIRRGYSTIEADYSGLQQQKPAAAPPSGPAPAPAPAPEAAAPAAAAPGSASAPGAAPAANVPPRSGPPTDESYDLLPERLRNIAGEGTAAVRQSRIEDRLLTSAEIKQLGQANQFQYFMQGAVGRTESGILLDAEENTLVFIQVYSREGRKVGAINFTVSDRSLHQADFLQNVAERIAASFDESLRQ